MIVFGGTGFVLSTSSSAIGRAGQHLCGQANCCGPCACCFPPRPCSGRRNMQLASEVRRSHALGQWTPGRRARGSHTAPKIIWVARCNHWLNSGFHTPQARGGGVKQGEPCGISTCQAQLRWSVAVHFGKEPLRGEGAWVLVLAAEAAHSTFSKFAGMQDCVKQRCHTALLLLCRTHCSKMEARGCGQAARCMQAF